MIDRFDDQSDLRDAVSVWGTASSFSQAIPRPAGAVDLAAPEWVAGVAEAFGAPGFGDLVADRLLELSPEPLASDHGPYLVEPRDSAVLVCVCFPYEKDEPHILLTRRRGDLGSHAGQIAFPGGLLEAGESHIDAALREANEEVSLVTEQFRFFGFLSDIATYASRHVITPVVGIYEGDPRDLVGSDDEVERVFTVALGRLGRSMRLECWPAGGLGNLVMPFFEVADEEIWGATGRLLEGLLEVIFVR